VWKKAACAELAREKHEARGAGPLASSLGTTYGALPQAPPVSAAALVLAPLASA
jgi:hypothetical protein